MRPMIALLLPVFIVLWACRAAGADAPEATPLQKACDLGDLDQVKRLLAQGAEVNARDELGATPLHRAAAGGRIELVRLLLEGNADAAAKDKDGLTPAHYALWRGHAAVAEAIIEKGAELDAYCASGLGKLRELTALLEADDQLLAAPDRRGNTPLHWACRCGAKKTIDHLLGKGAPVNLKNARGMTPLHLAVSSGNPELVGMLTARGAKVNAADESGRTPLHFAADPPADLPLLSRDQQQALVAALLAAGADPKAKDIQGRTPADLAAQEKDAKLIKAFKVIRPKPQQPQYVAGQVIVGFHPQVTEQEAAALVQSLDLTWTSHFPKLFSCWVKVLRGAPEEHAARLRASDIVRAVNTRSKPPGADDKAPYLFVQFNVRASEAAARQLISPAQGLEITSIVSAPKYGLVAVPPGEEQKYIERFSQEKIVKYAELNQIMHIDLP